MSKKVNFFFLTVLVFFYVINVLLILEIDNFLLFAGILLNINHLLLLLTAIRNTEKINHNISKADTIVTALLNHPVPQSILEERPLMIIKINKTAPAIALKVLRFFLF